MLLGSDRKLNKSEMTMFRILTRCELRLEGEIRGRRYFYRVIGKPREEFERIVNVEENGLRILRDKDEGLLDDAYEEGCKVNFDYGY